MHLMRVLTMAPQPQNNESETLPNTKEETSPDTLTESHVITKEIPVSSGNAWPENLGGGRLFARIGGLYTSWSFSYMNPILRKGKRQFEDGHHLSWNDLYDVPDDMRSEYLVKRFW